MGPGPKTLLRSFQTRCNQPGPANPSCPVPAMRKSAAVPFSRAYCVGAGPNRDRLRRGRCRRRRQSGNHRRRRHHARRRFRNADPVPVQRARRQLQQRRPVLRIRRRRRDQRVLRVRQVPLLLQHQRRGRSPQLVLLLLRVQRLRRIIAPACAALTCARSLVNANCALITWIRICV
jgi:hypothetical protein